MQDKSRFVRELRCQHCHRLFFKEYIRDGYIEIKCGACKEMNRFNFNYYKNMKPKSAIIMIKQKATDSINLKVGKGQKNYGRHYQSKNGSV